MRRSVTYFVFVCGESEGVFFSGVGASTTKKRTALRDTK